MLWTIAFGVVVSRGSPGMGGIERGLVAVEPRVLVAQGTHEGGEADRVADGGQQQIRRDVVAERHRGFAKFGHRGALFTRVSAKGA